MSDELLFTVHGSTATPAQPLTLADAGLRERRDLQEWVIAHPQILGPDILIVTMEFDRWQLTSSKNSDRLDVLGLHASGELVVAELKRDKAPDTVEMQGLKYAAMVSRFTVETLAEQHARYLTQRGIPTDDEAAADLLAAHATVTMESLRRPRVVLLASDFPPTTSTTAVWLGEMGIDITLMQYRAYRTGAEISISVSQLYPVPTIEDFTISPRQAEVRAAAASTQRRQDVGTVARLIAAGALEDEAQFTVRPYGVNEDLRAQLEVWLDEQPERRRAAWVNDTKHPLIWAMDGQAYSPTGLSQQILLQATGIDRNIRGTDWWIDSEERSLVELRSALAQRWTRESFMASVGERWGGEQVAVCTALYEWGERFLDRWDWGSGAQDGSMIAVVGDPGIAQVPFTVWTYGSIEIGFQYLRNWPPFSDERLRRELRRRLAEIAGVQIGDAALSRRPSVPIALLRDEASRKHFVETMEWVVSEIRAKDPRQSSAVSHAVTA